MGNSCCNRGSQRVEVSRVRHVEFWATRSPVDTFGLFDFRPGQPHPPALGAAFFSPVLVGLAPEAGEVFFANAFGTNAFTEKLAKMRVSLAGVEPMEKESIRAGAVWRVAMGETPLNPGEFVRFGRQVVELLGSVFPGKGIESDLFELANSQNPPVGGVTPILLSRAPSTNPPFGPINPPNPQPLYPPSSQPLYPSAPQLFNPSTPQPLYPSVTNISSLCRLCFAPEDPSRHLLRNVCPCSARTPVHLPCLSQFLEQRCVRQGPDCVTYLLSLMTCALCGGRYPPSIEVSNRRQKLLSVPWPAGWGGALVSVAHELTRAGPRALIFNRLEPGIDRLLPVGRDERAALRFSDPSVSRAHGALLWRQGRLFLLDNQSKFGSFTLLRGLTPLAELSGARLVVDRFLLEFIEREGPPKVPLIDPRSEDPRLLTEDPSAPRGTLPRPPPTRNPPRLSEFTLPNFSLSAFNPSQNLLLHEVSLPLSPFPPSSRRRLNSSSHYTETNPSLNLPAFNVRLPSQNTLLPPIPDLSDTDFLQEGNSIFPDPPRPSDH